MSKNGRTITDDLKPNPYTPPADTLAEIVLRLEATPPGKALVKVFDGRHRADNLQSALRNFIRRHNLPTDAVIIKARKEGDTSYLYAQRGPDFKQIEVVDGVVRRWQMPEDED